MSPISIVIISPQKSTKITVCSVVDENSILSITRVQSSFYFEHQTPVYDICRQEGPVLRAFVGNWRASHERMCVGDLPALWHTGGRKMEAVCLDKPFALFPVQAFVPADSSTSYFYMYETMY